MYWAEKFNTQKVNEILNIQLNIFQSRHHRSVWKNKILALLLFSVVTDNIGRHSES